MYATRQLSWVLNHETNFTARYHKILSCSNDRRGNAIAALTRDTSVKYTKDPTTGNFATVEALLSYLLSYVVVTMSRHYLSVSHHAYIDRNSIMPIMESPSIILDLANIASWPIRVK